MNESTLGEALPLSVPDRFESLKRRTSSEQLSSIVVAVDDTLRHIDKIYGQMRGSHRGGFLILRGDSGAGKSTFLHTVGQFRQGVHTESVAGDVDIRSFFASARTTGPLHIYVLEEREAAISFSDKELEDWLHTINGFIRTGRGENALVVWPCNTDELLNRVVDLARKIGAESLLGSSDPFVRFFGPDKIHYRKIAEITVAVLNQGASFADLGLSDIQIDNLVQSSSTIGGFLGRLRDAIQEQEEYVQTLLEQEQARVWVIVVAGNEPNQEVAALTRGRYAAVDIERLMTATEANIVQELKTYPEKLGILATALDAKILHLPVLCALSIARAFASEGLKARMKQVNLSLKPDKKTDAVVRLMATELSRIFASQSQGVLATGKKLGSSSVEAFSKLALIASSNDVWLNQTIGMALKEADLVNSFVLERDFGSGLTRRTDVIASTNTGDIRLEIMWRSKTSRADIANYTLTKLANYGKALGYLK
jgi:hypothetical protein